VRAEFGSRSRCVGLGMGFWVGEELILLRVKSCRAWDGVMAGVGVNLAQGQGVWGRGRGFG
jgi:hypothetical protein